MPPGGNPRLPPPPPTCLPPAPSLTSHRPWGAGPLAIREVGDERATECLRAGGRLARPGNCAARLPRRAGRPPEGGTPGARTPDPPGRVRLPAGPRLLLEGRPDRPRGRLHHLRRGPPFAGL